MLHRGNPVRSLLDEAMLGKRPSKRALDMLDEYDELPDGMTLGRFRERLRRAANELADLYEADGGVRRSQARSWEFAAELEADMTDEQAAVDGEPAHLAESLTDISKRMFSH